VRGDLRGRGQGGKRGAIEVKDEEGETDAPAMGTEGVTVVENGRCWGRALAELARIHIPLQ